MNIQHQIRVFLEDTAVTFVLIEYRIKENLEESQISKHLTSSITPFDFEVPKLSTLICSVKKVLS